MSLEEKSVSSLLEAKGNPIQQTQPTPKYTKIMPKKTLYVSMAFITVIAISIAIIVAVMIYYSNQLKRCREELDKQKRETIHAQQMLDSRLRQMEANNNDLPAEEIGDQINDQSAEKNPWLGEGTDPMGTRTRRDGALMGDTLMDRELRTNKTRVQPGTMIFPRS